MGWIRHHAIVVTTFEPDGGECIRKEALEFFDEMHVSPVMESRTNGYESVFIAPDGSKEGWEASNDGDDARTGFMEWLRTECPVWVDAVEVEYGEVEVFRVSDAVGDPENPQRKGGDGDVLTVRMHPLLEIALANITMNGEPAVTFWAEQEAK